MAFHLDVHRGRTSCASLWLAICRDRLPSAFSRRWNLQTSHATTVVVATPHGGASVVWPNGNDWRMGIGVYFWSLLCTAPRLTGCTQPATSVCLGTRNRTSDWSTFRNRRDPAYFLFTGILVQRIYDYTDKVAARHPEIEFVKAGYLNDHPLVLDVFKNRVEEILTGDNNMNCQMCKYRTQVLGFEAEVGLPQESHHHHVQGIGTDHSHDHDHGHHHHHEHNHD